MRGSRDAERHAHTYTQRLRGNGFSCSRVFDAHVARAGRKESNEYNNGEKR